MKELAWNPAPHLPADHRIDNKDLRALQGRMILERKLKGTSNRAIAEEFSLTEQTISLRIKEAMRDAHVQVAKDRVITDLLNPAIDAFKQLLLEGDYNAARDVLQGLGILPKGGPPQTQIAAKVEMTLEQWREMRQQHEQGTRTEGASGELSSGDSAIVGEAIVLVDGEDALSPGEGASDDAGASEGV